MMHHTAWQGASMGLMTQQMGIAAVNAKVLQLSNAAIMQVRGAVGAGGGQGAGDVAMHKWSV